MFSRLSYLLVSILLVLIPRLALADDPVPAPTSEPWSLMDALKSFLQYVWDTFSAWLVDLMPDWLTQNHFGDLWAQLTSSPYAQWVMYVAWLLGLDVAVPIIVGAYIAKFLLKRVPFVGG